MSSLGNKWQTSQKHLLKSGWNTNMVHRYVWKSVCSVRGRFLEEMALMVHESWWAGEQGEDKIHSEEESEPPGLRT
jgi:hypothetical protein